MSHALAAVAVIAAVIAVVCLFRRKRSGTGPADAPVDHGPETK